MSQTVKNEVLPRFRQRYITRGAKGKTALINELCELGDYIAASTPSSCSTAKWAAEQAIAEKEEDTFSTTKK